MEGAKKYFEPNDLPFPELSKPRVVSVCMTNVQSSNWEKGALGVEVFALKNRFWPPPTESASASTLKRLPKAICQQQPAGTFLITSGSDGSGDWVTAFLSAATD